MNAYVQARRPPGWPGARPGHLHLAQRWTFLLVGYGINDPLDLDLVFELNASVFGSGARMHYALMKDARQTDRDRWQRSMNVQAVDYRDHADLPAILRALRACRP